MDTLTITELIEKLETIRGRHGDLPVYRINDDYEIGLKATTLTDPYEKERETINVRHLKKSGDIVVIGTDKDEIDRTLDMFKDIEEKKV